MRRRGRVMGPEGAAAEGRRRAARGGAAYRPAVARSGRERDGDPGAGLEGDAVVRVVDSLLGYWIEGWSPAASGASDGGRSGPRRTSPCRSRARPRQRRRRPRRQGAGALSATGVDRSAEPATSRSGTAAEAGGTEPGEQHRAVRRSRTRGSRNRGRWNAVSKRRSSSDPPRRRGDGPCRVDRHVSTRRSRLPVGIVHPAVKHDHPTMVPVRCRTVGCGAVPRGRAERAARARGQWVVEDIGRPWAPRVTSA
jgi:hypothetical protein